MKPSTTDHPDRKKLTAFLDGRLSEAERVTVEGHVDQCEKCCQAMAALPQDTLSARLRDMNTDVDDDTIAEPRGPQKSNEDDGCPTELVDHPRYRIIEPLGKGGMGVVYKAEHRMMDRIVALKVIDAGFIENPQAIQRFRNEVKAAARLAHANIVRAYDAEQEGNLHFLVMEYVDGISLDELIRRNGPLPVQQVCGIARKVAQGLQHAFEHGMVHRDIKPQNIMVTLDGRVRILDFGLARLARERECESPSAVQGEDSESQMRRTADALTLVGSVLGTPDYIAPEQVMDPHKADTRADIYSLGCTCYFLLTGHPPFPNGTVMEKLVAHANHTPTPVEHERTDVPAELIAITSGMMARRPEDRYQTPVEVVRAVEEFMKTGPASTTVATATQIDQTNSATISDEPVPIVESELLKVDLSAISVEGSESSFRTDESTAVAGQIESSLSDSAVGSGSKPAKIERSAVADSTTESTVGGSDSEYQTASRGPRRKNRRVGRTTHTSSAKTDWKWLAIPGVAALAALIGLFAWSSGDNETEPVPSSSASNAAVPASSAGGSIDQPVTSTKESRSEWVDLLPYIDDNALSTAIGHWSLNGSELTVDKTEWARIQLAYDVPAQYEFEVTFTRHTGVNSIALIFVDNGHQATFDVDAWNETLAGIQNIDGQTCQLNPTRVEDMELTNGERYTASVRVLGDRVEAFLNNSLLTTYHGNGSNLSLINGWQLSNPGGIGLGAFSSATTFHQVRIRAINDQER